MRVKVGVRVRPYNQRENDLNCRLCVDMMGPTTRLFDADDPKKHQDFTFDYSFWSHDQFHTDERGYLVYLFYDKGATPRSMQTSSTFSSKWVSKSWQMLGKAIIAVSWLTDKMLLEKLIQCWAPELTKELFQFSVNRSSRGFPITKTKTKSSKWAFPCWKSTTRKCRICWCPSASDRRRATRSVNTKLWAFTSRVSPNIMLTPPIPLNPK